MFTSEARRQRPHRPVEGFLPNPKLRLMDQCREVMRFKRLALRSEQSYCDWIKRYIFFHAKRHPREMGEPEIKAFLTYLAAQRNVAASTQNQALSALLFLYREVLGLQLEWVDDFERARRPARVPLVLSKAEAQRVLAAAPVKH